MICLKEGWYQISATTASDNSSTYLLIFMNEPGGSNVEVQTIRIVSASSSVGQSFPVFLKRGTWISVKGEWGSTGTGEYDNFSIVRL